MTDFFMNWWKRILVLTFAITALGVAFADVGIVNSITAGVCIAIFICICLDEKQKDKEAIRLKNQKELCNNACHTIILFVFKLANRNLLGSDLDAPQDISDLYWEYIPFPDCSGFEIRIRLLSVGRMPIPSKTWCQKEKIFQADFDRGICAGYLTGIIRVKQFIYEDNAAWLDIEVIP